MSFETRFSEDEQVMLASLPTLIGTAMSLAAGSGMGTIKEMFSSAQSVMAGAKEFSSNAIIAGILPIAEGLSDSMTKAKELRAKLQESLKAQEVKTKEQLQQLVIDNCKKVNELLKSKAEPQEAAEYKKWSLDIAENVAKSASEGGFLGFGGTQLSDSEKKLFSDIASSLNIDRSLN